MRAVSLCLFVACALSAPTTADGVVAEYVGVTDGFVGVAGPDNQVGQSFHAQIGGRLTTVELSLKRNGVLPATLHLELRATDGAGLPTGGVLAESVLTTTLPASFTWVSFDFAAAAFDLVAGQSYALTLRSEAGDGGYLWANKSANPYAPGSGLLFQNGGPWKLMKNTTIGDRDTLFSVRATVTGATTVLGCGVNPTGSMSVLSGAPAIGSLLVLGVDNPLGTQAPGSIPFLFLAYAPDPATPCGTLVPGIGMGGLGATGELLVGVTGPSSILTGPSWSGAGVPAAFTLTIPNQVGLVGKTAYLQGAILDPTISGGVLLGVANAVELLIGD